MVISVRFEDTDIALALDRLSCSSRSQSWMSEAGTLDFGSLSAGRGGTAGWSRLPKMAEPDGKPCNNG